jgi:integrase
MGLFVYERKWWPLGPDGKPDKSVDPNRAWSFQVSALDPNGRRITVRRKAQKQTEAAARKEAERVRDSIVRGTYEDAPTGPETFTEVSKAFLASRKASGRIRQSTLRNYEDLVNRVLVPAFGKLPAGEVEGGPVERWTEDHGKGKSVATVRAALVVLRACLRWAYQRRYLDSAPRIELPKKQAAIQRPKFLAPEQLGKLLAAAQEPWRTWILVGARTGLRCGEMLALRWSAVDLKKRTLQVLASLNDEDEETSPKSHQAREVPLSTQAVAALEALPREEGQEFVFPTIRTRHQVGGAMVRLAKTAGLGRIGPHRLRNTFISHALQNAVPIRTVQLWAGHSSIAQTEAYAVGAAPVASVDVLDAAA